MKSLQFFLTLYNPVDRDPLGKNTGVGCHVLLQGNLPKSISLTSPALVGRFFTTSAHSITEVIKDQSLSFLTPCLLNSSHTGSSALSPSSAGRLAGSPQSGTKEAGTPVTSSTDSNPSPPGNLKGSPGLYWRPRRKAKLSSSSDSKCCPNSAIPNRQQERYGIK